MVICFSPVFAPVTSVPTNVLLELVMMSKRFLWVLMKLLNHFHRHSMVLAWVTKLPVLLTSFTMTPKSRFLNLALSLIQTVIPSLNNVLKASSTTTVIASKSIFASILRSIIAARELSASSWIPSLSFNVLLYLTYVLPIHVLLSLPVRWATIWQIIAVHVVTETLQATIHAQEIHAIQHHVKLAKNATTLLLARRSVSNELVTTTILVNALISTNVKMVSQTVNRMQTVSI